VARHRPRTLLVALAVSGALAGAGGAAGQGTFASPSGIASALPRPLNPSTGKTFYVSPDGSDANPGTLPRPWRTIQKALNTLKPGQRALVRAGTYKEGLAMRRSGTAAKPITVAAYPGERPVVDAPSGTGDTYAIQIKGSYFRLRGFVLQGASGGSSTNVYADFGSHHLEIRENEIRGSADQGFYSEPDTSSVQLIGNLIHDNGSGEARHQSHGIYMQGTGHLVANNVVYNHPYGFGIQVYPSNRDTIVVGNTVVASGYSGIVIGGDQGVRGITIRNNIFALNRQWGIAHDMDNPADSRADHNVLFANRYGPIQPGFSGTDFSGGNIVGDPRFVKPAAGNFRLGPGSPAIDRALPEYSKPVDYDGRRRPQGRAPDIGAFERPK